MHIDIVSLENKIGKHEIVDIGTTSLSDFE